MMQEEFAGVVARRRTEPVEVVESLWGRISAFEPRESTRQALGRSGRDLGALFESLLVLSFVEGLAEALGVQFFVEYSCRT